MNSSPARGRFIFGERRLILDLKWIKNAILLTKPEQKDTKYKRVSFKE
jgi:hypothetical protein